MRCAFAAAAQLQERVDFLQIFESLGGSLDTSLFDQLDADGDGEVTFKEFKTALKGWRGKVRDDD